MRWLVCCLLFPLGAQAASVLLVPEDEKARALAGELVDGFSDAQLTVKTAPAGSPAVACLQDKAQRTACLAAVGEKSKSIGVFVVSGAMKGNKGTLTLELIVNGAVTKRETTWVLRGRVKTQMKGPLANFIKLLPMGTGTATAAPEPAKVTVTDAPPKEEPVAEEVTPAPAVVADAPKKTERAPSLTPNPRAEDQLDLRTEVKPAGKPKVAAWVVTGLTVVAAGVSITTAALGASDKGRLETLNTDGTSALSYQQALALQNSANGNFTVALGAGIGAGVGAVVSGILWGME
jgi:hypothetical protein